jgi:hypothetical protein
MNKKMYLCDGDTFEHEGMRFKVGFERYDGYSEPWKEFDGHGEVSDWTRRDKRPGEIVLSSDHGSKRYYDVQATTAKAKRDGWGLTEEHKAELLSRLRRAVFGVRCEDGEFRVREQCGPWKPLTQGEITAEAVRRDFEYLRGWCNDDWTFNVVTVTLMVEGEDDEWHESTDPNCEESVGGVEDYNDYHIETAYELAGNVARYARREGIEAAHWAARDVATQ